LLRAIVVREEARIDHTLSVLDGLLNGPGEPQDFAGAAGGVEVITGSTPTVQTADLWTLLRRSARAVRERLVFELRWRPIRVRKRLRRIREHYDDLKRFDGAAKGEAVARREEEHFLRERRARHRSSHLAGSQENSAHVSEAD
jgi:hypothetical protein